jgi:hypothetical protein
VVVVVVVVDLVDGRRGCSRLGVIIMLTADGTAV